MAPRHGHVTAALAAAAIASLAPVAAAAASGGGDVTGWWLDASGRAGILIAPYGERLCGRMAWLREPRTAEGAPKTDKHNGDPALRGRPLCGLTILQGFAPDGPGTWQGGRIYNPDDGATYRSTLRLQADGTLSVRGYVGVPWFGKSQIWTRPSGTLQPCAAAP